MKRKQVEYEKAMVLRKTGRSIKKIAKLLDVSVSIVHVWTKDVELTDEQRERVMLRKF